MNTPLLAPRLLIVLALVLGAARASGADAGSKVIWSPPRLAIEGKSTGAASLSTQLGFTVAYHELDVLPSLTYEIQSANGIGTLLALKEDSGGVTQATPPPWDLGATVNLRGWGKGSVPAAAREALDKAKKEALEVCAPTCQGSTDKPDKPVGPGVKKFCDARARLPKESANDPAAYSPDEFCEDGLKLINNTHEAHPSLVSTQRPYNANVGFKIGGAKFRHLGPDSANPGQLVETTTLRTPWMIGGNVAWLTEERGTTWTVEGLLTHGVAYDGAEDTARYCVPAGDVTNGGGTVPATICKDLGASGPSRSERTRFGAYIGWFDAPSNVWRASLGFEHTISSGKHRTSVSLPIYRLFSGTTEYKGMVRLAPTISFSKDPTAATIYSITISLLGQREFFSEKFDRL